MKLKTLDTIKTPITINVPRNGGGFAREKMTAHYAVLNQDEIESLLELDDDAATLERVFVGFSGVSDEDGTTIEDNAETREMLTNITYIRKAIIFGFFDMIGGGKRKN